MDSQLQGGNFYKTNEQQQISNQLNGQENNFYNSYLISNENMAVLRDSNKNVPLEKVDVFAQFLQIQQQQGNFEPQQLLKSAVQIQKQKQEADQLYIANQGGQLEAAVMKRLDFSKSNHPTACFFHLFFKVCALFSHLVLSLFMNTLNIHYLVIIFSSFDFWITKNISGRLLIGLRWWSECQSDNTTNLQIISVLSWAALLLINVIGVDFGDSAVCAFSLFTTFWNAYYFYKCNTKQKEGLKKLATEIQSDIPFNLMHGSLRFPL